eukprot:Em0007g1424a
MKQYYWPSMHLDIRKWISECESCQRMNPSVKCPTLDLQPVPVTGLWEMFGAGDIVTDQGIEFVNKETFVSRVIIRTAKASYAKNKASPSGSGTSDSMGSQAQITRKRTKDTSGPEASPHTSQCRPVAKRLTPERPGRRLTYPDCHNSQTDNCTEPLSDSINDQVPGTTDGPGDQELHVIGAPNVSQNSAEVTEASLIVLKPCDNTTEDAMAAPTSVKEAVSKVSRMVNDECSLLCKKSAQPVSLFRHMSLEQAEKFTWTQAISEISTKAPTLFSIVNNCVVTQRSASRNKHKKGDAQYPGLCTAVAILLKERNRVMCGVQSYTWTQLNHMNVTLTYDAILKRVNEISQQHTKVMDEWLRGGAFVKFVGDNVDKQCNVSDIRSDHHGELRHMFSLLAIKACISPPAPLPEFSPPSLMSHHLDCFLPSREDMKVILSDMEVLVARILCDYVKDLRQLKKFVVPHIPHTYSDKMAVKSDVLVLDGATMSLVNENMQGAKRHVMCSNTREGRLEQLEPCVEDWHCVMNFMMLIWQKLVKISPRDHGSLTQLFTRLGRLSKAKKPKDDMHACQGALLTVFKGHTVAAACRELNIGGPEGDIKDIIVNMSLLNDLTVKVARRFTVIPEAFLNESVPDTGDQVHSYAQVLCHFAAIVHLFTDACKEGDGERIIRCWKLCMLHFHAERKTKYALEALRLQFQLVTLQPYLVHQLTWGSTRAARAVSSLERLALGFERQTGIHPEATAHSRRSDVKDVQIVAEVVLQARILEVIDERYHSKFPNFSSNPLNRLDREKMIIWIQKKAKQHSKISDTSAGSDDDDDEDEEDSAIVVDEINEMEDY